MKTLSILSLIVFALSIGCSRQSVDDKATKKPSVETDDRWHFTVPAGLNAADVISILRGLPPVGGIRQFVAKIDTIEGGKVEVMAWTYDGVMEKKPGVWEMGSAGGEIIRFHPNGNGTWACEGRVGSWNGFYGPYTELFDKHPR